MNLAYAVERLYQTGWTLLGEWELDRLPDGRANVFRRHYELHRHAQRGLLVVDRRPGRRVTGRRP